MKSSDKPLLANFYSTTFYGYSNKFLFYQISYLIDTLGHQINGITYIVPGLDFIKLQGIVDDKSNTRYHYNIKEVDNKIVVVATKPPEEDEENSFILSLSNLEYYSIYGMLPTKNNYDHITINLVEIFNEGNKIM